MTIGIPGLLGLIFIVLKLTGVIAWSWWWVLAPFYAIPVLFVIALIAMILPWVISGGR